MLGKKLKKHLLTCLPDDICFLPLLDAAVVDTTEHNGQHHKDSKQTSSPRNSNNDGGFGVYTRAGWGHGTLLTSERVHS